MEEERGVSWDVKDFKKLFPALYREIVTSKRSIKIDAVRTDVDEAEREASRSLRGFMPGPLDYLRRCSSDEEALSVIEYLEKRGELSGDFAERLRMQVKEKGVRSFGSMKESGYYLRKYGLK